MPSVVGQSLPPNLHTPNTQCFSLKWGIFDQDQLAVATATNFGMRGPGKLYIFSPFSSLQPSRSFDTNDALHDVAWSESSPTVLVAGSADGSMYLFDTNRPGDRSHHSWTRLHGREVSSVDWNGVNKDMLLSSSFDGSVVMMNMRSAQPVGRVQVGDQGNCANEVAWNPRDPFRYAVVSSDRGIRIFDARQQGPVQTVENAHAAEILCVDWNKYEPMMLASGSVDQQVAVWDLRMTASLPTATPTVSLSGHYRAVRRVKWSPFQRNQLASCGYDMTVRLWSTDSLVPMLRPPYTAHTEFVTGLSYSLKRPGLLASCSWDDTVHMHDCMQAVKPIVI